MVDSSISGDLGQPDDDDYDVGSVVACLRPLGCGAKPSAIMGAASLWPQTREMSDQHLMGPKLDQQMTLRAWAQTWSA